MYDKHALETQSMPYFLRGKKKAKHAFMSEQLAPAKWVEPIKLKAQAHVYELGSGLAQLFFIGLTNNLKNSFFFFIYKWVELGPPHIAWSLTQPSNHVLLQTYYRT